MLTTACYDSEIVGDGSFSPLMIVYAERKSAAGKTSYVIRRPPEPGHSKQLLDLLPTNNWTLVQNQDTLDTRKKVPREPDRICFSLRLLVDRSSEPLIVPSTVIESLKDLLTIWLDGTIWSETYSDG